MANVGDLRHLNQTGPGLRWPRGSAVYPRGRRSLQSLPGGYVSVLALPAAQRVKAHVSCSLWASAKVATSAVATISTSLRSSRSWHTSHVSEAITWCPLGLERPPFQIRSLGSPRAGRMTRNEPSHVTLRAMLRPHQGGP